MTPENLNHILAECYERAVVGARIRFAEEKQAYTIRARNDRFLVCNKPFNPRHTVLYTVVDIAEQVRGTENSVFCMGAETDMDCREMLVRLNAGRAEQVRKRLDAGRSYTCSSEVSHRNRIPLNVSAVLPPKE